MIFAKTGGVLTFVLTLTSIATVTERNPKSILLPSRRKTAPRRLWVKQPADSHKTQKRRFGSLAASKRKALRTQGTNTAINSDLLHSDTLLLPFQAFANCLPIACRLFACCSPTTRDLASHNISRNAKRALHHVSCEAASVGRSERLPRNAKPPLPMPMTTAQLSLNAPAFPLPSPTFSSSC